MPGGFLKYFFVVVSGVMFLNYFLTKAHSVSDGRTHTYKYKLAQIQKQECRFNCMIYIDIYLRIQH